jgi:hypothetical protein
VSDPRGAGRRAKKGAAQGGSLTPRLSLCSARQRRRPENGGTERRRPQARSRRRGKKIEAWTSCKAQCQPCTRERSGVSQGNGAPEFRFPPPVPPLKCPKHGHPGKERRANDGGVDECYGGPSISGEAAISRASLPHRSRPARHARSVPGALRGCLRRRSRPRQRAGPAFGFGRR